MKKKDRITTLVYLIIFYLTVLIRTYAVYIKTGNVSIISIIMMIVCAILLVIVIIKKYKKGK